MRAVVQRVACASVEVEGRIVSEIGPGLLVLVGLHESDVDSDADYICRKVLNMRLFPNDKSGKNWDQNVMQKNYGVLLGYFSCAMEIIRDGKWKECIVGYLIDKNIPFLAVIGACLGANL
ncbi:D-Tyr-tRNA(Tyr) deacylase family protein [Actinidia rufa]|uniref:D-aminoacyl-tRNA deacylase n=1 Tax=Actinidia rufa TaxID=165716 RepID=A0A7J0G5Q7_9ERIC|nr:D-Tyr-tRNA(Tyr) deacylase family protein [Actinidia rufa]